MSQWHFQMLFAQLQWGKKTALNLGNRGRALQFMTWHKFIWPAADLLVGPGSFLAPPCTLHEKQHLTKLKLTLTQRWVVGVKSRRCQWAAHIVQGVCLTQDTSMLCLKPVQCCSGFCMLFHVIMHALLLLVGFELSEVSKTILISIDLILCLPDVPWQLRLLMAFCLPLLYKSLICEVHK